MRLTAAGIRHRDRLGSGAVVQRHVRGRDRRTDRLQAGVGDGRVAGGVDRTVVCVATRDIVESSRHIDQFLNWDEIQKFDPQKQVEAFNAIKAKKHNKCVLLS